MARSDLHSPHSKLPVLHFRDRSNDTFPLSKKWLRYQKTGHASGSPPNILCSPTDGCPPVYAPEILFSIVSGSSVVKIALVGFDDDILPFISRLGTNLLWTWAGL